MLSVYLNRKHWEAPDK